MNLTLKIWRQNDLDDRGAMHEYQVKGIPEGSPSLEMLDILSEDLLARGKEPIAFSSDCRERIYGQCGIVINGVTHDPEVTATCQPHTRAFRDGDVITIEPWRVDVFPLIKDLVVNRSAPDRIIQAGGYTLVNIDVAPDAYATPAPKQDADRVFEVAACIGCGACVVVCPNASAILFTSAKVTHLRLPPQGKSENYKRVVNMFSQMDEEGFGTCSNIDECVAVCPKRIPLDAIVTLSRQLSRAVLKGTRAAYGHRGTLADSLSTGAPSYAALGEELHTASPLHPGLELEKRGRGEEVRMRRRQEAFVKKRGRGEEGRSSTKRQGAWGTLAVPQSMVNKIGVEAKNMAEYTISKTDTSEAKPTGEQRPACRSWVVLTIFVMSVFTLPSVLVLVGLIFGLADIKALADYALPWPLLALALAGVAMAVAKRRPRAQADEA